VTLSVFDPNITANSPAGSCLLKMLLAARADYDLELFTTRTDLAPGAGVKIHRMPVPMKPVFLQSILFTIVSVALRPTRQNRIIISTQGGFPFCDISYAHCCHKLFLTRYRSHITGGFLTRTARLINHRWSAAMEAIAFRRASVIVVPSEGLAQELIAAYGPPLAAKLRIIANPVDCEAFSPNTPTVEREFTFAFCALGNFEWKGLGLILQALAMGIPAHLNVIGGTYTEIERFRSLAKTLGVAGRVTFLGLQSDIRPHLWTSDVFVFPSVYETFPLVCLQAAAAGLALIATDLYGLGKLLQPGVSGWRVERTVESVSQAMYAALADKEATARMGWQARTLAQQYDVPAFQEAWLELMCRFL
jgi:glycosyltransferase involved in cell wall biosynthesis